MSLYHSRRPPKARAGILPLELILDRAHILKRLGFRAWHRGTREADFMIGGFFDTHSASWSDEEVLWFERLLEEDDVDVMAWAIGTQPVPAEYDGPLMAAMQKLDYIPIAP